MHPGMTRFAVPPFSLLRYRREVKRLEEAYQNQINTVVTFLTTEQHALTTRFFESIANRVTQVFDLLNKEVDIWLAAVISPMESQVREHQRQLRKRLESVKRIQEAAGTLDDRLKELGAELSVSERRLHDLSETETRMRTVLATRACSAAEQSV